MVIVSAVIVVSVVAVVIIVLTVEDEPVVAKVIS